MLPLVSEIVFVEELFSDAQAEMRKCDYPRVIAKSDPTEVCNALLFAMNKGVKSGHDEREIRRRRFRNTASPVC